MVDGQASEKRMRKRVQGMGDSERISEGNWSMKENIFFAKFLSKNTRTILTKVVKKKQKIFLRMSEFVRTRTSDQCRSHFQKMMIKHGSLENIVDYYTKGQSQPDDNIKVKIEEAVIKK